MPYAPRERLQGSLLAACKTLGIRRKRAAPLHLRTLRGNGSLGIDSCER
jgi:hypothetical protein